MGENFEGDSIYLENTSSIRFELFNGPGTNQRIILNQMSKFSGGIAI
ncbi:hypothetical protein GMB86_13875 [Terrilactibacillus sp. BCM23-1]|uniref:Uncharacterized protein n=1 Tax=Terrilactibacillus tamarindi TaxID=2599694 RepID=A0A6N8CWM3_9BACI|nr:hypothetical protein [Terrilactibacillus tamarindi]MTT33096.1 hypothetical protein [Terrilactibacillus tamarindi]